MGKNLIQNWDYRWKLVSFIILIFSISFLNNPGSMIFAFIISIIVLILSGIKFRTAVKSLRPPLILLIFMSPFILLTPGVTLIFQWNFLQIYTESLILIYSIAMKSVSIFIVITALLYRAEIPKLMQAMNALGIPGKLVAILISTYRYIYLYMEDLGKLLRAAKLRGFSMRKGFSHMQTSADILLTLLIRSYEQSERVQAAMIMRGYRGEYFLTENFETRPSDFVLTFVFILLSAAIISGEYIC